MDLLEMLKDRLRREGYFEPPYQDPLAAKFAQTRNLPRVGPANAPTAAEQLGALGGGIADLGRGLAGYKGLDDPGTRRALAGALGGNLRWGEPGIAAPPSPTPLPEPQIAPRPVEPVRLPPELGGSAPTAVASAPRPMVAPSAPPPAALPEYGKMGPSEFDTELGERGYPVQPAAKAPMDLLFSGMNVPRSGFAGMEAPPEGEDGKGNRWARLGGKVVDALIGPGAKGMTKTEKAMTLMLSLGQGVRTGLGMQYGYQGPSFLEAARMYGKQYEEEEPMRQFREYVNQRLSQPGLKDWEKTQLLAESAGVSLPRDPYLQHDLNLERDRLNEQQYRDRPAKQSQAYRKRTVHLGGDLYQDEERESGGGWTPYGEPYKKRAKGAGGYTEQKRSSDAKTIRSRRQAIIEMDPALRASWAMENPGQVRALTAYNPMIPDEETDAFRKELGTNLGGFESMVPRDVRPVIEGEAPEEGGGWFDWARGGEEKAGEAAEGPVKGQRATDRQGRTIEFDGENWRVVE